MTRTHNRDRVLTQSHATSVEASTRVTSNKLVELQLKVLPTLTQRVQTLVSMTALYTMFIGV